MDTKTIQELREWEKKWPHSTLMGAKEFNEILSRATPAEAVEPLAVLADRKGVYIEWEANYEEEWHIGIDGVKVKQEDFKAPTYAAAEAKVRAYLSSLPDKEGPTTDWTKEGR